MSHNQFRIRPRTPADDERILAIRNAIDPDLPPVTVEALRGDLDSIPDGVRYEMWVAEEAGGVVGRITLRHGPWHKDPGLYEADIRVAPDHWRRGIGACLYAHLLDRAGVVGATRLLGSVRDDVAMRFVSKRGFQLSGRQMHTSRLDVVEANLAGYEGLEKRLEAEGILIRTLTQLDDTPQLRRALYALDMETSADIPQSDEFAAISYELWEREVFEKSGIFPELIWIALDGGRPVGAHYLALGEGDTASNDYLGVARTHRGRGIARALKLLSIEWAQSHRIQTIYTGNLTENIRMLDINTRLGYKQLPPRVEVVKEL